MAAQGQRFEGSCAVCGKRVEYVDYHPGLFLCLSCGFPDPAPEVEADENGRAYIKEVR